jgi:tubulin--tyrosine ligase-like protein 12
VAKRVLINGHSLFCPEPSSNDLEIDAIHQDLFKIAGCYRLASSEQLDETSIWYVNDEVGSAIEHSDLPNAKLIPFLYSEDNRVGQNMFAYSILWPVKDISSGELVCRDWLHGYS